MITPRAEQLCSLARCLPRKNRRTAVDARSNARYANCAGGPSEHIDWILAAGTSYFRTDGTGILTTNANGIFVFGTATNPIVTSTLYAWTGLASNWTEFSNRCTDWISSSGGVFGMVGNAGVATSQMISGPGTPGCDVAQHLICVEQ